MKVIWNRIPYSRLETLHDGLLQNLHSDKKLLNQSGESMPAVLHRKLLVEWMRKAKHVPNYLCKHQMVFPFLFKGEKEKSSLNKYILVCFNFFLPECRACMSKITGNHREIIYQWCAHFSHLTAELELELKFWGISWSVKLELNRRLQTRCGKIVVLGYTFFELIESHPIYPVHTQSMTVLYDIHSGIISLTKWLSLLTGNELHAPSHNRICTEPP